LKNQEPLFLLLHLKKYPHTRQPFPVEFELDFFVGVFDGRPVSFVPNCDGACPVLTFGDFALEGSVRERVVVDLNRKAFHRGVGRGLFRNRPREEDSAVFQTEIIMRARGDVVLDDEVQGFHNPSIDKAARLWYFILKEIL